MTMQAGEDGASRSLTMLNALNQLQITDKCVVVHVIGADFREGVSLNETKQIFHQFFQECASTTIHLVLIGPNIPPVLHRSTYADELVKIDYFVGLWEDYAESRSFVKAQCSFCFNAGIWGYDEWVPTIQHLVVKCNQPVVITSYNELEALDDFDTLSDCENFKWAWQPCQNPNASPILRPSKSIPGRFLAENAFWQCILPCNL